MKGITLLLTLSLLSLSSLLKIDRSNTKRENYLLFLEQQNTLQEECQVTYTKKDNDDRCEGDADCVSGFCQQDVELEDETRQLRTDPSSEFVTQDVILANEGFRSYNKYCAPYKQRKSSCVCDQECLSNRCSRNWKDVREIGRGLYCRRDLREESN